MICRGCRSDRLEPVFEMDPMPLAGTFHATREEARDAERFPLTWLECRDCGLVNVAPDIPDRLIYSTYSYAASTVPGLVRHHREFAADLAWRYDNPRVLEIGCNDGVLLNQLPAHWEKVGVDPSDVAYQATLEGDGRYILIPLPFTSELASGLGMFDLVSTSNSLAHFTDIADALDGVAQCLKIGGEFYVEVHNLQATLNSRQWDTIYHEHKVEWSPEALLSCVLPLGFQLIDLSHLPLHGGLIRARFRRTREGHLRATRMHDFAPLREAYEAREAVPCEAAYGAAARASVYLNQCDTGAAYVVDGSPLRAGRFVPGVGLPIVTPDEFDADPPARTLITAWNHAEDIKARHPDYDGWATAW